MLNAGPAGLAVFGGTFDACWGRVTAGLGAAVAGAGAAGAGAAAEDVAGAASGPTRLTKGTEVSASVTSGLPGEVDGRVVWTPVADEGSERSGVDMVGVPIAERSAVPAGVSFARRRATVESTVERVAMSGAADVDAAAEDVDSEAAF